jgi:hypothetical protein
MLEAVATLAADQDAPYEGLGLPAWKRDPDGIFRNVARPIDDWDFRKLRQRQQLASWPNVEKAFKEDSRLSHQVDTVVGTIQSGLRVEPINFALRVIPRPSEIGRAEENFEQRYAQLESYLVADELDFRVIWPVPGLIVETMPVELEPDMVLDAMSDRELVTALRTETVRPPFGTESILFQAEPAKRLSSSSARYPGPSGGTRLSQHLPGQHDGTYDGRCRVEPCWIDAALLRGS